jgi:hypothetical protein
MFNSKAVADFKESSWLSDQLDKITGPIRAFIRKLKRFVAYGMHGYNTYDWDYGYLFEMLEFKLKRMQHEIINGHHTPDKATDQSLRLCLKLLKKLNGRDYHYFMDIHNAKWGESEWVFHRHDEDGKEIENGCSRLEIIKPNANTPEEKAQERAEFSIAYKKDDAQQARDKRLLFRIMEKYHQCWWD